MMDQKTSFHRDPALQGQPSLEPGYMSGFGNSFETEALPGALPIGRNSPQKLNYGLYAEQLSGSPFTAPRSTNERSWLYRIRPSVKHSGRYRKVDKGFLRSAPAAREESELPIGQLRWGPIAVPNEKLTFVSGLRTMTTAGDADTQTGMAAHLVLVTQAMENEFFFNADGEFLVVAQEGRLRFRTEFGIIDIEPGEICVIPRGVVFRAEPLDKVARAYVCENYGGAFTLPDRGPIGANCLANARDFLTPVAAYEDVEAPCTMYAKWGGELYAARRRSVAARRRRLAWQLRAVQIRPAPLLAGRRDLLRSPRSVDLHGADRAVGNVGHGQCRLRHLSRALERRREYLPAAVVSPQHHVGVHGPDLRRLRRAAARLRARRHLAAQLHAGARPRRRGLRDGQHRQARSRSSSPAPWPSCSRPAIRSALTTYAAESPMLDRDYQDCWTGLKKHFRP